MVMNKQYLSMLYNNIVQIVLLGLAWFSLGLSIVEALDIDLGLISNQLI